uniref:Reverse transcriptase domain-containing protein n=1 Tax=Parascaris univalens TaxID=6257 RepID=A0A915A200_PARUN
MQHEDGEYRGDKQVGKQPKMLNFWKSIIGESKPFVVSQTKYLEMWRERQKAVYPEDALVPKTELGKFYEEALRKARPFKAAGPDGLYAYWWKSLPTAGRLLEDIIVEWLSAGKVSRDALSPLLFVLCISPISFALEEMASPYRSSASQRSGKTFSLGHQFYIDDLKIYAPNRRVLLQALTVAHEISKVIGLDLNIEKCAQAHYMPKMKELEIQAEEDEISAIPIPVLGLRQSYRYLGIDEKILITRDALQRFEESLYNRASAIFRSQLTWRKMVNAFLSIALGGLRYGFLNTNGVGPRLTEALKKARDIDVRIREILADSKCRFRKSIVDRLYVSRGLGGYGLKSVESLPEDTIVATFSYLALGPEMTPQYHLFESLGKRGKRTPVTDGQKILAQYGIEVEVDSEGRDIGLQPIEVRGSD